MSVGGVDTIDGKYVLPIATRTRRRGLKLNGTAVRSRGVSLAATMQPLTWDQSFSSLEMPVEIRTKAAGAHRLISDLGNVASNASARLISGAGVSTNYTSLASATWSEWEKVSENWRKTVASGSCVLCYIAGGQLFSYEVRTLPLGRP